jgi:predicted ATP-grasp superfamily ATP-dependent carboligase
MTLYLKEIMNPWNKTVLFSKYNNVWEPIMLHNDNNIIKKIFDYNDDIIKKILTENSISYYEKKKDFIFNDNTSEESVHTDSEEKYKNYNKTKLTKMKVSELEELCKSLKLELKVRTTKASMIELILKEVEV